MLLLQEPSLLPLLSSPSSLGSKAVLLNSVYHIWYSFFFFFNISFVCDLIFSVHIIFDQFVAFSDVIVSGFILYIYFFFCFSGSSLNWGL